jgi:hypothetical protein
MSKFLDFLSRIREGASTPLGFGATRGEKLPGMALVGLVSGDHAKGVGVAAEVGADAMIIAGVDGPDGVKTLAASFPAKPWGARVSSLGAGEAQSYEDGGSDLLVFNLEGTAASALASQDIARILSVDPGIEEHRLRAVASLPVDAFLLPMTGVSSAWTLQDLATVGAISRRVDKYTLVEVSQPPGKQDLEALRDIGINGLVLDVGAVSTESLKELRADLLEMPRARSGRRERSRAILPGSVYAAAPTPSREDDDEEEDD